MEKEIKGEVLNCEREWRPIRHVIFWTAFCVLLAVAALEGGYILGYHDRDEIKGKVQQLKDWALDHGGRIQALETMEQRGKAGSGKPNN